MRLQIINKNSSRTHITVFCFILILCNCQPKPKKVQLKETVTQNVPTRYIDFVKNAKVVDKIKLSDIADSVEYIPLDISNNVLISKIQGLYITDSLILVKDKGATYLFNSVGQFQKSLYSLGRGPGEAYGTQIAIDNKNGNIYVGNRWTLKVMNFSTNGEFKNERKYKHFLWQFYLLNNMLVFAGYESPKDYSFYAQYTGTDSVCYKHPFRYNYLPPSYGGYSVMYIWFDVFEESLFFKEQVCDTIFSTTNFKNIKPAYILDFGSRGLKPKDFFTNNPNKFDNKQLITAFKEKSNFLLMKGVDNNELCQFLYDKKREQLLKTFDLRIANDIDGGPSLHFWEIDNSNYDSKVLCFFVEPFELLDEANKPLINSKLEQIRKSININSNPVLVKAYLKR